MYKFIKVAPFPHPSDTIYSMKRELSSAYFPSSLTWCFIIYQMSASWTRTKKKKKMWNLSFLLLLAWPNLKKKKSTSRGRGRARGVDLREGARGGEEGEQWGTGERKPRGGGARARAGKEAPRPPWWIAEVKASGWHYVNHRDSQAMRWWLQGARAVLCSPDARAPCYFFFPPTTLGVDSSWPWSLGRKKKILQEITSPSWTHIAQLAQQEGKQKKKKRERGGCDMSLCGSSSSLDATRRLPTAFCSDQKSIWLHHAPWLCLVFKGST